MTEKQEAWLSFIYIWTVVNKNRDFNTMHDGYGCYENSSQVSDLSFLAENNYLDGHVRLGDGWDWIFNITQKGIDYLKSINYKNKYGDGKAYSYMEMYK